MSGPGSGRRALLTPRWLLAHLAVLALLVAMVLLGRWQLDVSNAKHFNLQNFGYALQWWAFTIFAIVMWRRVVRDALRRIADGPAPSLSSQQAEAAAVDAEPVAYRRYLMPQSSDGPVPTDDPEQAAYNDYLARLNRDAGDDRVDSDRKGTN